MKKQSLTNNFMQTATVMMMLTLVSKLCGFCRELVFASYYGTSYVMDAFVLAQTIPSVLLGGLLTAISTSFVPCYSNIKETRGNEAGDGFTRSIINLVVFLAFGVFIVGALFSETIVSLFAREFSAEAHDLTSLYLKITFAYTLFSCVVMTLTSYLQYKGKFYAPIIGGYFYNFGIIVVAIISAKTDIRLFAFGPLLGYSLHLLTVYAAARKSGYRHSLRISSAYYADIKQALKLSVPVFFSSSLAIVNSFVDKSLAASLSEGCISALSYGTTLVNMITGLTTTIIITILYPKLAQALNQGEKDLYRMMVQKCSSILMLIAIPFTFGILAFSEQVVQIIYERGSFDVSSTALTGETFLFYGLGLLFIAMNDLLSKVYYSMQDVKTPIICAAISIVVNIILNLILIRSLEHKGLALSTSIAAGINMLGMTLCLRKKDAALRVFPSKEKSIRIIVAAAAAVLLSVGIYDVLFSIWMPRMIQLAVAVIAAGIAYLLLLKIFKIEEIDMLKALLKRA